MNDRSVEISVIVPAYRSALSAPELVRRLMMTLRRMARPFEIVIVDDDSPDETWDVLCRIRESVGDELVLVRLVFNAGQHNALMCGFRQARGRIIVTIDDDLQADPEDAEKLIRKLEADHLDLVYGNYPIRQHNLLRNIAAIPIRLFADQAFRLRIATTSFRAIRAEILGPLLAYRGPFPVIDGLLCWSTRRIGAVPVDHHPRPHGRSTYTLAKLIGLALNIFTNFSLIPLRLLALVGSILFLVGLIPLMRGDGTLGAIYIVGGLQLAGMSLLGEYVGRVLLRFNGQPTYLVREVRASPAENCMPEEYASSSKTT